MTELVVPDQVTQVGLYPSDPGLMVSTVMAQATQLADIIEKRKLFTMIQKKKHVSVEGWTTLGAMLGVFPVVEWSRELVDENGANLGWEARVEARTLAGNVVGAAEAECRRSENTWKLRDSYAIRSMAQTRATSKALRLPLGFVMALAGYEATPTDERLAGAVNQAKREVLAMVGGDKAEAVGMWELALATLELDADDAEAHIEEILAAIAEMVELSNEKEVTDGDT